MFALAQWTGSTGPPGPVRGPRGRAAPDAVSAACPRLHRWHEGCNSRPRGPTSAVANVIAVSPANPLVSRRMPRVSGLFELELERVRLRAMLAIERMSPTSDAQVRERMGADLARLEERLDEVRIGARATALA